MNESVSGINSILVYAASECTRWPCCPVCLPRLPCPPACLLVGRGDDSILPTSSAKKTQVTQEKDDSTHNSMRTSQHGPRGEMVMDSGWKKIKVQPVKEEKVGCGCTVM